MNMPTSSHCVGRYLEFNIVAALPSGIWLQTVAPVQHNSVHIPEISEVEIMLCLHLNTFTINTIF